MKVEIKEQVKSKYPYVGVCDDVKVLFVAENTGIALNHHVYQEGYFSESWSEELFTPLPPNSVTITI